MEVFKEKVPEDIVSSLKFNSICIDNDKIRKADYLSEKLNSERRAIGLGANEEEDESDDEFGYPEDDTDEEEENRQRRRRK